MYLLSQKESDFDYFDDDGFYELNLRVVRFKITKELINNQKVKHKEELNR